MRLKVVFPITTLPVFAADVESVPPVGKVQAKVMEMHGDTRTDNYCWLREKTNPAVIEYLEAENKYTEAVMKDTDALQKKLYAEILGRIKETDMNVPSRQGDFFYYVRVEKGKQYNINCRKPAGSNAEQVLIDQNELAKGQKYFRLGTLRPSFDHQMVAFSTATKGDENYTIQVKDLKTGNLLADAVTNNQGVVQWANDNKTFLYVTLDASKRPERVWRHTLGEKQADDKLVYYEQDERFFVEIAKSRSGRFLFIDSGSTNTTEVRFLDANAPGREFKVIHPRQDETDDDVEA